MSTIPLETTNQPRLNYAQVAPATLEAMLGLQRTVDRSGLETSLLRL